MFPRVYILLTFTLTLASAQAGDLSDFTQQTMSEVVKIARAISVVNPNLDETKYVEYALGIYRASQRYDIESHVLVSIAQQETGFRESLPEGAAGEIGICQIRKNWLENKAFRGEFERPTLKDLKHPARNFMMAAWILRDLKKTTSSKSLPYWSFYNARKFENRFKYFLLVNRNIATLRRYAASLGPTAAPTPVPVAAAPAAPIAASTPATVGAYRAPAEQGRGYWSPDAKVLRD